MGSIAEVRRVLTSLRGVWDEVAVDEYDHALQCGHLARLDGADDELLLACVLHDVAHSPVIAGPHARAHEELAREWLTPRFGERVGWLAGSHVAAKQYLVAADADYARSLTATSMVSLGRQGGAGVDPRVVDHRWFPDALRLRRFDDAAKTPGAPTMDIEEVLAVAAAVRVRV
ncbi:HD family phosphohydrolase [Williamsia sterculiae]|uniref:Predicted HD phosphohydrolase n=1 Tax=Williamsia sterculiae TaxID=1344003 RepID=A0A1N7DGX0_9NOCA|nr:HD family phosphohydrolase [Williamsia sterculiae]SIR74995.1 Predicted HD phosphohydrolase [Williamsia sterculiae]